MKNITLTIQPIETAPEGVTVFAYDQRTNEWLVAWRNGKSWTSTLEYVDGGSFRYNFTHWTEYLPNPNDWD